MTANTKLIFNQSPNQEKLGKLIDSRIAAKLDQILGPLWGNRELAQQMTIPDIAEFIAGTAIAAAPGASGIIDLVLIFGLFGAIAGYRNDANGSVNNDGIRLASLMLQPAMPNINDLLKDPALVEQINLAPRSRLALQVVLEMIQRVES